MVCVSGCEGCGGEQIIPSDPHNRPFHTHRALVLQLVHELGYFAPDIICIAIEHNHTLLKGTREGEKGNYGNIAQSFPSSYLPWWLLLWTNGVGNDAVFFGERNGHTSKKITTRQLHRRCGLGAHHMGMMGRGGWEGPTYLRRVECPRALIVILCLCGLTDVTPEVGKDTKTSGIKLPWTHTHTHTHTVLNRR